MRSSPRIINESFDLFKCGMFLITLLCLHIRVRVVRSLFSVLIGLVPWLALITLVTGFIWFIYLILQAFVESVSSFVQNFCLEGREDDCTAPNIVHQPVFLCQPLHEMPLPSRRELVHNLTPKVWTEPKRNYDLDSDVPSALGVPTERVGIGHACGGDEVYVMQQKSAQQVRSKFAAQFEPEDVTRSIPEAVRHSTSEALTGSKPVAMESEDMRLFKAETMIQSRPEAVSQSKTEALSQSKTGAVRLFKAEAVRYSGLETVRQSKTEAGRHSKAEAVKQSESEAVQKSRPEAVRHSKAEGVKQSRTEAMMQFKAKAVRQSRPETVRQSNTEAVRHFKSETKRQPTSGAEKQLKTKAARQSKTEAVRQFKAETVRQSESEAVKSRPEAVMQSKHEAVKKSRPKDVKKSRHETVKKSKSEAQRVDKATAAEHNVRIKFGLQNDIALAGREVKRSREERFRPPVLYNEAEAKLALVGKMLRKGRRTLKRIKKQFILARSKSASEVEVDEERGMSKRQRIQPVSPVAAPLHVLTSERPLGRIGVRTMVAIERDYHNVVERYRAYAMLVSAPWPRRNVEKRRKAAELHLHRRGILVGKSSVALLCSKSAPPRTQSGYMLPRSSNEATDAPDYGAGPMEISPIEDTFAELPQVAAPQGPCMVQSVGDMMVDITMPPHEANTETAPPNGIHVPKLLQAAQTTGKVSMVAKMSRPLVDISFSHLSRGAISHFPYTSQTAGGVWKIPSHDARMMPSPPIDSHSSNSLQIATPRMLSLSQAIPPLDGPSEVASKQAPKHPSNDASFGQRRTDVARPSNGQREVVGTSAPQGRKMLRIRRTLPTQGPPQPLPPCPVDQPEDEEDKEDGGGKRRRSKQGGR